MRPVRLAIEGFTAFADRQEIDFADADMFALVGPTGSGKSSVIDAITFALYGSVARYDNAKLVAPVIHQRCVAAKVDFEFELAGRRYRAYREVARTAKGASQKEVRLESGDVTLAGDAKGMSEQVERLLGLNFDQFTTCVVLPQGEFARFLHDTPRGREKLLVQLLDLGSYQRMGQLARARARTADDQMALLDDLLREMGDPVDAAELRQRVVGLETLRDELDARRPELDALAETTATASAKVEAARELVQVLSAITVPEGLDSLGEAVATADLERARADRAEEEATAHVAAAEAALAALPPAERLAALERDHAAMGELAEQLARGDEHVEVARDEVAAAEAALTACQATLAEAEAALAACRHQHAAADLAEGLAPGDDCPVCGNAVGELPTHDRHDLDRLGAATTAAADAREAAAGAHAGARERLAGHEQRLASLAERRTAVGERLSGEPTADAVGALVVQVSEAGANVERARAAQTAALGQRRAAEARRSKLDKLERSSWSAFGEARDRLARLDPPAGDGDDLVGAWTGLASWAAAQLLHQAEVVESERHAAAEATESMVALGRLLDDKAAALGVTVPPVDPGTGGPRRDQVVDALADVAARLAAVEAREVDRARRVADRASLAAHAAVAGLVGRLLGAKGFVTWLLDEAVDQLVSGATVRLLELSTGRYSLVADGDAALHVVDHHNADERRPARTLSGGETFLASLSLALALAEHVATMAPAGSARLESIFLDEGFGSLDPETLEVVVSAIEDLQATGRVVGLVSHVPELAARVPVRFEVRRGLTSATVERVEA